MLKLDNKIDFTKYSAEEIFVDSAKLKKNIENTIKDISTITNNTEEDNFIKINIGLSGGFIRPIIVSTNLLKDFLNSQYIIANTLSENSMKLLGGNQEDEE